MDGWIEWSGGKPPVNLETIVEVRLRDGQANSGAAITFCWSHEVMDDDIVAYRIVGA